MRGPPPLLAVDDSKTMRKVIEITFAGEGFKTVVVANAGDAVAKAQSEQPGGARGRCAGRH
jgi:CheY-like chemotaxis protein